MLTIKIELRNDAIVNGNDLPRILRELADSINDSGTDLENGFYRPLRDINGNEVGYAEIE